MSSKLKQLTIPVCTALALTLLPAPLTAQQATTTETEPQPIMAQIEQAWKRGDYVFVRKELQKLAEGEGTALAQYRYARVLIEGRGGPRDVRGAVSWLEKAVAQNHIEAATLLARVLLSTPPGDPDRARSLLARAAARGDAEAQVIYGSMLAETEPDVAFAWFLAAAEQGRADAQFEVARAHQLGKGTAANPDEAISWLTEAATNGHVEAQFMLANSLEKGSHGSPDPAGALEWYRRAAEAGLPIAQRILGGRYLTGDGVELNATEAQRWLEAAAKAGDPGAMYNLGLAHLDGSVLAQDDARAFAWIERASTDLARAITMLAKLTESGRGTQVDFDRAVTLYRQAADLKDEDAQVRLGALAANGRLDGIMAPARAVPWTLAALKAGDEKALEWLQDRAEEGLRDAQAALGFHLLTTAEPADTQAAVEWLVAAASAGDLQAQAALGQSYATGENGVDQDYVAAHTWLNIAAASGDPEALKTREVISAVMTPDQIAEAQERARALFDKIDAAVPRQASQ